MFPLLPLLLLPFPFIHSLPQSTANPSSSTIFCGKADYTPSELRAASLRACDLVLAGSTAGSSSYPHEYRNLEDFAFDDIPGPYYEFPILDSGKVYSGGKPGPDRVVVAQPEECVVVGQITHTGAKGNKFVGCDGTT